MSDLYWTFMYAKLFSSLLSSSIWSEELETRIVFVTLLAMADREGYIYGSPVGLAALARLPVDATLKALDKLKSPDHYSSDLKRDQERDGSRIRDLDQGGWFIINYTYYRDLSDADVRRAKDRAYKRHRRGMSTNVRSVPIPSESVLPSESSSEAESDTESKPKRERERFAPPSLQECREFFKTEILSGDADSFFHHYEANGWRSGKAPLRKWKNAAHGWSRREASFQVVTGRQDPIPSTPVVDDAKAAWLKADADREAAAQQKVAEELAELDRVRKERGL